MRDYAKVSPQFWIGTTGKALRKAGWEAQLVAMYLMTSPHANMLGLYYLPKLFLIHETGLSPEGASKGLAGASEALFCAYDDASEMVWVYEMATYQVGSQLKAEDKRCAGVQNEYNTLPDNPYLKGFFDKYKDVFHLTECRAPSKGLQGGFKAPPKPRTGAGARTGVKPLKSGLPEGFTLTPDLADYVAKQIPDADPVGLFEDFCGKAKQKGWQYVDWNAAFQTYCRNAKPTSGHFSAGQYPKRRADSIFAPGMDWR